MIRGIFLFFSCLSMANAAQYALQVGDTTVIIKQQHHGYGKAFVHVHQNETTALKAARAVVKAKGGSVLTLVHPGGGRNVVFHVGKRRYEFDPNRIYTDRGIKKTLTEFGSYSRVAHQEVKKLATKITSLLPQGKIIAVHNNSTYSLKNYFRGHDLARDAQAININKRHFYRNFYLATNQHDYTRFRQLNFNSVWQATDVVDDGSLSVYLSRNRYVNVEAGYDQLAEQIRMLRYA